MEDHGYGELEYKVETQWGDMVQINKVKEHSPQREEQVA